MRRFLLSTVFFCLGLTFLTSCLNETEYSYYDDAAITSFVLGTLNRYYTVEGSEGQDSTVKKTLSCADYSFSIDQLNGLIWNEDSLPIDIDASKVICTVTSKNSGTILYKSLISDSLFYYSSSDSIDFTEPRTFVVYGSSGLTYRTYTVNVNVHKEVGDTCIWTQLQSANAALGGLTDMKGLSDGEKIYLFGSDGTATKLYTTAVNDGKTWSETALSPSLPPSASKNAIMKGETFYIYSDGELLRSDDAQYWDVAAEIDIKQLLGASSANLYALSSDGKSILRSADEGSTWTEETLDDDCSLLPTEDLSFTCRAMTTNTETDKIVIIGNRGEDYPGDTTAVVWSKVDEYGAGARNNAWNYTAFAGDNYYNTAPRACNWQAVNYDENNIKAICGSGKYGSSATAFDRIYHSGDDGITWRNDSIMTVPEGFSSSETAFALVADKVNSVWIICGGTGQVWKGRINRVAWKKEQDYFIE